MEPVLAASENDDVMDALGNDVRREIIAILAQGPQPAGAIAAHFAISRPAISKHLRQLKAARLIAVDRHGTRQVYRLDNHGFDTARAWLDQFWPEALQRFRMVAENTYERGGND